MFPDLVNYHGTFNPQKPLNFANPDFMRQRGAHSTGGYPTPQAPWMSLSYVPDFMSLGGLDGGCCGWNNILMTRDPKTGIWALRNEGPANPSENFMPKGRQKFTVPPFGLGQTPLPTSIRKRAAGIIRRAGYKKIISPNRRRFKRKPTGVMPKPKPVNRFGTGPLPGKKRVSPTATARPRHPRYFALSGDYYSVPGMYSSLGGFGLGEVDLLYKQQMTADIIGYRSQVAKANSVNAHAVYAHGLKLQKQLLDLGDWEDSSWFCVKRAGSGGYCTKLYLSQELDRLLNEVHDKYGPFDMNQVKTASANALPQKDKSIFQKATELTAGEQEKAMIRREEEQKKALEAQRVLREIEQLLANAQQALASNAKAQAVSIYKEILKSHKGHLTAEQKAFINDRLKSIDQELKAFVAGQKESAALIKAGQQADIAKMKELEKLSAALNQKDESDNKMIYAAVGGSALLLGAYLYFKRR